ncbi:hypothetical protein MBAV_004356 [Candidatus Magnetobacterium bavaricum]|uniref:Uncharacterized protein n=1 Tax=Candidatus Magnetobacterium bavaricum TaxID=29290 RepID=A0A0F3GND8_9BACT|nr:hypothetical protein MBAV_004356 [Candidatus Magnetobacterium bavaricum]
MSSTNICKDAKGRVCYNTWQLHYHFDNRLAIKCGKGFINTAIAATPAIMIAPNLIESRSSSSLKSRLVGKPSSIKLDIAPA